MTRTTPRKPRRSRGKTSIALLTAVAALAGGAQALAPTPASAYLDGAGCTVDKWGFLVCEAPQTGDQGWPWEDGSGSTKGNGNGGDAPSNVNGGNGYDDGNGNWIGNPKKNSPTPPWSNPKLPPINRPDRPGGGFGWDDEDGPRKPGETDAELNRRFRRQNCRQTRTVYLRVKTEGIGWVARVFTLPLGTTKADLLDDLADDYIDHNCFNALGPLRN